jgi:hypothetical protein
MATTSLVKNTSRAVIEPRTNCNDQIRLLAGKDFPIKPMEGWGMLIVYGKGGSGWDG